MSAGPLNDLLQDEPGKKIALLGNVGIVRGAIEAGLQFFSCYPGTPSSEVGDTLSQVASDIDIEFEYAVNEKIAVETSFAAALTGARAMCAMKHLGLNSANDPISTMPYVGVEGGLIIVAAGDPSVITSPNEQDQRHFNRFLFYPIFDPSTPEDARAMTRYAFDFSEKTRLPVIMRPTTRVCHTSGMVELGPIVQEKNKIDYKKNPSRHTPIPINARRMRTDLTKRFEYAEELLSESAFYPREGSGKRGIITSGVAYTYVKGVVDSLNLSDQVTIQKIGAYPIPKKIINDFLDQVDSVLVVEELTPFVEDIVTMQAYRHGVQIPILGKNSGHFPIEFEYNPDLVEDGIRRYLELPKKEEVAVKIPELPSRPPVLCPGCPHRNSFLLMRKAFGGSTTYCNDIGCYTLGYGEPLEACDMLLCMGSSISQASGVSRMTKKRTVAYIGDSTFFHSGMPAVVNAVQANDNITIVILNNYVTAMTGFQPSVVAKKKAQTPAEFAFSLERLVKGLGVEQVYSTNPFEEEKTLDIMKKARKDSGVNVIICNAPCAIYDRKVNKDKNLIPFVIDLEKCDACSMCVRSLGCPAIMVTDGEYSIDPALCDGCHLCAEICTRDAISPIEQTEVKK